MNTTAANAGQPTAVSTASGLSRKATHVAKTIARAKGIPDPDRMAQKSRRMSTQHGRSANSCGSCKEFGSDDKISDSAIPVSVNALATSAKRITAYEEGKVSLRVAP